MRAPGAGAPQAAGRRGAPQVRGPHLAGAGAGAGAGRAARPARAAAAGPHVAVVGGGVAGLTTALRLLEELPGARVQVFAEEFGAGTSAGAAGYWEPFKLSDTPQAAIHRWGKATFEHLRALTHARDAAAAGVATVAAQSLFREQAPDPFWSDIVPGFHRMAPEELRLYSASVDWRSAPVAAALRGGPPGAPAAWVSGYAFGSLICEGRLYMRWLISQIRSRGGELVQRRMAGLADLAGEGHDAVVLAAGLGSAQLSGGDADAYPIRGQIARVRARWVRHCVFGHWSDHEVTYIIPNREWVVVGGTAQLGDWRTQVDLGDADAIMQRAVQLVPSLESAELLDNWVGLRPGRKQVRVELEWVKLDGEGPSGTPGAAAPGGATPVVHNYGHGGAGLTLAWGTAGDAVQLVRKALEL